MYTAKRRGNYSSNKSKCISILHITFDERLRDFQFPTWGNSKQITSSHVMNQSEAIFGEETGKLKNS